MPGVSALAQAFGAQEGVTRWALVLTGLVSLVVAFLAIFRPGLTAVALTWVLGLWWTARGVLECVLGLVNHVGSTRWVALLGALFLSNPGGAVGIAVVLGLSALVWGVALLGLGLWVRRSRAVGAHDSHAT